MRIICMLGVFSAFLAGGVVATEHASSPDLTSEEWLAALGRFTSSCYVWSADEACRVASDFLSLDATWLYITVYCGLQMNSFLVRRVNGRIECECDITLHPVGGKKLATTIGSSKTFDEMLADIVMPAGYYSAFLDYIVRFCDCLAHVPGFSSSAALALLCPRCSASERNIITAFQKLYAETTYEKRTLSIVSPSGETLSLDVRKDERNRLVFQPNAHTECHLRVRTPAHVLRLRRAEGVLRLQ